MVLNAFTPFATVAVCAMVTVSVSTALSMSVPVISAVAGASDAVAPAVVKVLAADTLEVHWPAAHVDGHVRVEGDEITVDLFDSRVSDPERAHIDSYNFPDTAEGRRDANEQLQDNGLGPIGWPPAWAGGR